MSGNVERRSLGCTVPVSLYVKTKERAARQGLTPASYVRNLVIADLGDRDALTEELGLSDTELFAACVAMARKLMSTVPRETVLQLAREAVLSDRDIG